jgi:hypothetical protein
VPEEDFNAYRDSTLGELDQGFRVAA